MTTDDRITEALRNVPTAAQRPLADIKARGRAHKRRRAAAVGMGVIASAGLLALPASSLLGRGDSDGPTVATAPEPPPCPTDVWMISAAEQELMDFDYLRGPHQLPDEIRLLWPESVAAAPMHAESSVARPIVPLDDYFASCSITQRLATLTYLDGDEVVGRVSIQYASVPYEHPRPRGDEPSPVERVIPAGDGEIGVWHGETGKDVLGATWGNDEESWQIVTRYRLSDEELVELADAARFVDGTIALGDWPFELGHRPFAEDAVHIRQGPISARESESYSLNVHLSGGRSLSIHTSSEDLLSGARPGQRLIDLDGRQALLEQAPDDGSVEVTWKPSPDVLASVRADADAEGLVLDIARSLGPVPADDARLTEVWDNSMAESWNE